MTMSYFFQAEFLVLQFATSMSLFSFDLYPILASIVFYLLLISRLLWLVLSLFLTLQTFDDINPCTALAKSPCESGLTSNFYFFHVGRQVLPSFAFLISKAIRMFPSSLVALSCSFYLHASILISACSHPLTLLSLALQVLTLWLTSPFAVSKMQLTCSFSISQS